MIQNLIKIILGTTITIGAGVGGPKWIQDLSDEQKTELHETRVEVVQSLDQDSKDFILSLDEKRKRDLTPEELEKLDSIISSINQSMLDNLDDENLKQLLEEHFKNREEHREMMESVRVHFEAMRGMSEEEREDYLNSLDEETREFIQNHKSRRFGKGNGPKGNNKGNK